MTTADVLGVIAILAGLVMASAPVFQIRRMRRTQSSHDVSLQYLVMLNAGFLAFIAYGLSIGNAVLIITNCASFSIMVITILTALYYRRGGAKRAAAALALEQQAANPAASGD